MRVAHLSDTHLGFAQYGGEEADSGANAREMDGYRAFRQACARIVELKPDLVVHSGDLFDHPRPPNRAIVTALVEFSALAERGIPVVVASGNHCLPAARGTACILEIFRAVRGVHAVFDGPGVVRLPGATVACVPSMRREKEFLEAVAGARTESGRPNILVVHAPLREGGWRTGGGCALPRAMVRERAAEFDYVALGHYHRPFMAAPMAWYAGSTERIDDDDDDPEKCFLVADLEKRAVERHVLETRPMVAVEPLNCKGMDAGQVLAEIGLSTSAVPVGAIVRLTLDGVSPPVAQQLDLRRLRSRVPQALHVVVRVRSRRARSPAAGDWLRGPLGDRFEAFAKPRIADDRLRESVLDAARRYFKEAEEERASP